MADAPRSKYTMFYCFCVIPLCIVVHCRICVEGDVIFRETCGMFYVPLPCVLPAVSMLPVYYIYRPVCNERTDI